MPPTKPSKHTKQSRVKARGQASRQQACGEFEGQRPSIGEAVQTRHRELVGRTKYRRKEVKEKDLSKPKAGNSPRKERTQFQ